VAHSYNTSYHAAIKNTPFYLMFGRKPDPLPTPHVTPIEDEGNVQRIRRWKTARSATQKGLEEAQQRAREDFDSSRARPAPPPQVGDCVLVTVPKPPKTAVRKLYPKYVGPYKILHIRGPTLEITPLYRAPNGWTGQQTFRVHLDRTRPCEHDHPARYTWEDLVQPFEPEPDPAEVDPRLDREDDAPHSGVVPGDLDPELGEPELPVGAALTGALPEADNHQGEEGYDAILTRPIILKRPAL
jgi:hypothetical protein